MANGTSDLGVQNISFFPEASPLHVHGVFEGGEPAPSMGL
jgi:hypothetical protein